MINKHDSISWEAMRSLFGGLILMLHSVGHGAFDSKNHSRL